MAFAFLQRGSLTESARQLSLSGYVPSLALENLVPGIDNVRHDVFLSPRFIETSRLHLFKLIARHGAVEDLAGTDAISTSKPIPRFAPRSATPAPKLPEPGEFKTLLADLHIVSVTRAKSENNQSIDLLLRLAVLKFLRAELPAQFAQVLERCRATIKQYEGPRHMNPGRTLEVRDRLARFQINKKAVLRRVGQDLFQAGREIEKETLGRTRRSLFGDSTLATYDLFLNRLMFTEDGHDDYLNAEHYVMLGNYDRDPDRFLTMQEIAGRFLKSLGVTGDDDHEMEAILNVPENAQELFSAGAPEDSTAKGRNSPANLHAAVKRVESCKGPERAKVAGRFMADFTRYHRDLRRMEALLSVMDSVNVIMNERFRELSSINSTLYEFQLPEEQRPSEEKIMHHVVLKADIRESTTVTRTLLERGQNPASYFSLNFYDPISKLLPKYEAQKVFIEGDAIILGLFEREGEPGMGVARTCVLAREIIEIVTAHNERSRAAGLPDLELGIGISYQDSAPLYLVDGSQRIMISRALNESDRLSSCSKGLRRALEPLDLLFNVYSFKTVDDENTGGNPDEFLLRYNVGGIHINEAAFRKLETEISLRSHDLQLPGIWQTNTVRLYSGVVPIGQGLFHKIVVREGFVPHIDARDFSLKQYTDKRYYEVCTNPRIYKAVE